MKPFIRPGLPGWIPRSLLRSISVFSYINAPELAPGSFTTYVLFVLLALLARAQAIDFADYFEDATMRIDYFHTANATCDEIAVDQIYVNDVWAGNPKKLLPPMENGRYAIEVVDIASNKLIYWTVKRSCSDVQIKGVTIAAAGRADF